MQTTKCATAIAPVVALAALVACTGGPDASTAADGARVRIDSAALAAFAPLPEVAEAEGRRRTPEMVDLGRKLYYDTRLSATGEVSCYTCHPLHDFGTSHRTRGVGVGRQQGPRNDPTVYNAAGQVAQFWDGRAANVEEQAGGPVLNPIEMGVESKAALEGKLRSISGYPDLFAEAFPGDADPVSFKNFRLAVGAFERGLMTPAPWDRFLHGDRSALTVEQKRGFRTFVEVGCVSCHNGPRVGGGMYQKLGAAEPWPDTTDLGRYEVTADEGDRMVFKVAMLRNVSHTWPYLHDGSVRRLEDAVRLMGRYQLGVELDDRQVGEIMAWLDALKGEIPEGYIDDPRLPDGPAPVAGP